MSPGSRLMFTVRIVATLSGSVQDFTDAKAVAAKDAGCRLEMVIELVSAEAAVALREKAATAAAAAREE